MRLTGWQRLGIAASIIWAIGASVLTHNADAVRAADFANFSYKVCADNKSLAHDSDLSSCLEKRGKSLTTWMEGSDANAAFTALVPIPFGWLSAFIILFAGRAQIVGFRAVVPWATLNWPKKGLVTFSVLAGLAAILFGIVVVLNLYVDTQVPVALGYRVMVVKSGEDFVTVEGTWTRSGPTLDSTMGNPLQTSRIECNKQEHRCTEARASVVGSVGNSNLLMSDIIAYDIESWTAASIVLRNDALCATEVFTIDLNTQAVSGAGHVINKDSDYCKLYAGKEERWNYQLSDGFKVYWEQRQKARPVLLRLIQTLFGN